MVGGPCLPEALEYPVLCIAICDEPGLLVHNLSANCTVEDGKDDNVDGQIASSGRRFAIFGYRKVRPNVWRWVKHSAPDISQVMASFNAWHRERGVYNRLPSPSTTTLPLLATHLFRERDRRICLIPKPRTSRCPVRCILCRHFFPTGALYWR